MLNKTIQANNALKIYHLGVNNYLLRNVFDD